jgi:hypothetical protein
MLRFVRYIVSGRTVSSKHRVGTRWRDENNIVSAMQSTASVALLAACLKIDQAACSSAFDASTAEHRCNGRRCCVDDTTLSEPRVTPISSGGYASQQRQLSGVGRGAAASLRRQALRQVDDGGQTLLGLPASGFFRIAVAIGIAAALAGIGIGVLVDRGFGG